MIAKTETPPALPLPKANASAEDLKSPPKVSQESVPSPMPSEPAEISSGNSWNFAFLAVAVLLATGLLSYRFRKSRNRRLSRFESVLGKDRVGNEEAVLPEEPNPAHDLILESLSDFGGDAEWESLEDVPQSPPDYMAEDTADSEADSEPEKPSSPSEQELETLLSLLDEKYRILWEASHADHQAAPDLERTETPFPEPTPPPEAEPQPESEADYEASISDYMNNLLSKYPASTTRQPESAAPATTGMTATAAPPIPVEPKRETKPEAKLTQLPRQYGTEVPKPVYDYDLKTTRSQLEQLRETSNATAANAIRLATSRRRRQRLRQFTLLGGTSLLIYAAYLYFTL